MKLHCKAIQLTPDKVPRLLPVQLCLSPHSWVFFDLLLLLHKLLHVFPSLDHLCLFLPLKEQFPADCSLWVPGGQGKAGPRDGFGKHLSDKLNSAL